MTLHDDLPSIAAQIHAAWLSGRICSLVGRGCRARILRLIRLVEQGQVPPETALRLARETEAVAFCLAPLPPGDDV
ncbi:hypothetical protein [Methylobacterium sp. AMS5]|uniref:hypothetical protein n=1 Tax=Methylobacterium sp. AMS5 TaxID=925818 RepID=UPI00074FA5C1|nr:hypothetical protein [Methylobacterium sp. AMS5]AMB45052.1 hypothetical protein Y590_09100 [Methylobacterium sp. AMS5]